MIEKHAEVMQPDCCEPGGTSESTNRLVSIVDRVKSIEVTRSSPLPLTFGIDWRRYAVLSRLRSTIGGLEVGTRHNIQ